MLTPVELAKLKLNIETRRLNGQKNPWAAPDAACTNMVEIYKRMPTKVWNQIVRRGEAIFGKEWYRYVTYPEYAQVFEVAAHDLGDCQEEKVAEFKRETPHVIELKLEHASKRAHKTALTSKVSAWLKKKANGGGAYAVYWHRAKPYIAFERVDTAMLFKMSHW